MLKIGEIVGPHGVRGEVKLIPFTDSTKRFCQLDKVTIRKGNQTRELNLAQVREHKNFILMKFKEISDRNQAEELRNWEMVVPYNSAVPLPEGYFYDHQLEGLEVFDVNDNLSLGILAEVMHLPANAVYRVEKADGASILIPALKAIVKVVDLERRRMYVAPMDGLLE
ncbi:MAG: ribosome maturation factor RimM [Eubacteriales bacterium]|nr:ribosome maturation factor RimM [Eubacteriales bacterium]MDD4078245.1 ribosome maturation factor RimM [Eubacteriales bacterium]